MAVAIEVFKGGDDRCENTTYNGQIGGIQRNRVGKVRGSELTFPRPYILLEEAAYNVDRMKIEISADMSVLS